MDEITLYSKVGIDATAVSNIFIDTYMPAASGSYVKVYLYLLRCITGNVKNFSISYLADRLDDTEKDIVRALKYWEKVQLIQLSDNGSGIITSITLNEPCPLPSSQEEDKALFLKEVAALSPSLPSPSEADTAAVEHPAYPDMPPNEHPAYPSVTVPPDSPSTAERPVYTTAQISELTNNDEVKWIMNIIELYLERPLKSTDIQLILYLYESVQFPPELIMYLYEYCISKNKKNVSYIETVALAWAEAGIRTVEEAEAANALYNSSYHAVSKAFGLNRSPGTVEKTYIDKWVTRFGFEIPIIVEACNRTVLNTQKADFKYADKILESWYSNQVKKTEDIKKLDAQFHAHRNANPMERQQRDPSPKPAGNRFHAFPQRTYSKEDYQNMEKRLLGR